MCVVKQYNTRFTDSVPESVLSSNTTLVSQILYLNNSLIEFPTIVYKHNHKE
jgi:hypothetical protein